MPDIVELRVVETDPQRIVPEVNSVALVEAVSTFEAGRGYEPAGGYGGLVPAYFKHGDLSAYFLGRAGRQWPEPGRLWLLGCRCGEVVCWPLEARVDVTAQFVVWKDFRQPYRPDRSYAGFGPFVFDREQYDVSVSTVVDGLAPTTELP